MVETILPDLTSMRNGKCPTIAPPNFKLEIKEKRQ